MSKKSFLDSINVKTPCLQSWNEMRGSDQIRFCDHCAKDVHNLSEMTRKQARKIVAQSNGGICVRYIRRPDGRIQMIKNTLHQITRQTGIAAGILGTSLSVSTFAYAQDEINPSKDLREKTETAEVAKKEIVEPKETKAATILGTVSDQNGAVIPATNISLTNEKTNKVRTITTNEEGIYEFKNVSAGTYNLKIEAAYFTPHLLTEINVGETGEIKQDVSLEVSGQTALMGVVAVAEYEHTLLAAVSDDNLEEVKSLVIKGENVNAKDKNYNGITAMFLAVENGNLEIVETLLNAGAKVNARDVEKRTPLMNLDDDATPELVNLLLRHGAKVNLADKEKNTALIFASDYANKDVVQALIYAGADVNAVNRQGETALMNAAENNETEIVQLLLGSGADANARNRDGKTALSLAKTEEAKQYLIAYGATR